MIRVVSTPPIQFTCTYCKAVNEGDPSDFREEHTMPPRFVARCGFCRADVRCFPTALVARVAGAMLAPGKEGG